MSQIGRVGITETLNAPGLVAAPPVSKGAQMLNQLRVALGVTGQLAGQAGAMAARETQRRKIEKHEIDAMYAGQAALDINAKLPIMLQQIAERDLLVPSGAKVEEHVRQMFEPELAGMEEAYAKVYRRAIPTVIKAFVKQQEQMSAEQTAENSELILGGAMSAATVKDLRTADAALAEMNPRWTDRERLAFIVPPLLAHAVKTRDHKLFEAVAGFVGKKGQAGAKTEEAKLALQDADRRVEAQRKAMANADRIEAARISAEKVRQTTGGIYAHIVGEKFEAAQAALDKSDLDTTNRAMWQDRINDAVARRERDELREKTNEYDGMIRNLAVPKADILAAIDGDPALNDTEKLSLTNHVNAQRGNAELARERAGMEAKIIGAAGAAMDNAVETGGAAILDDVTYTDSTGRDHTVTREAQIKANLAPKMLQLVVENEDESPEVAFAKQMQYLSRNGLTYDRYTRIMEAGVLAILPDMTRLAESGAAKDLPANLQAGYNLYKRIGAISTSLRNQHLGGSSAAREFYKNAQLAETFITQGDVPASLLTALKAQARVDAGGGLASRVNATEFQEALDGVLDNPRWFAGEAQNTSEIGAKLENIARLHINAFGIAPDKAIEAAVDDIQETHTIINDWMIATHNRRVPPGIDKISTLVIKRYVEKYGYKPLPEPPAPGGSAVRSLDQGEVVEVGDLTLVPGPSPSTWVLFNKNSNTWVEHWQEAGIFTNADLMRLSLATEKAAEKAEIARLAAEHRSPTISVRGPTVPGFDIPRRFFLMDTGFPQAFETIYDRHPELLPPREAPYPWAPQAAP